MIATEKRKSLFRLHAGYTQFNDAKLVKGGKEYFQCLLDLIEQARYSIHFQVYIFDEDETGIMVANALMNAAKRNVKVYLLVDGYASKDLSGKFIEDLRHSGVFFRHFDPVLKTSNFYFGRRMHHKVVVIDGYHSLVGGINISNKYNDIDDTPAWLDWAIYTKGDIAIELQKVCVKLFTRSSMKRKRLITHDSEKAGTCEECFIRVRRNDWVQRKTQISSSYFEMLRNAHDHIIIMSSYFLPGYGIRKQLAKAAARNVQITVILAGSSDIKIAKYAERFIYRWLLKKKIRIYEFQPSVLHAKIATYDKKWVTIGSYNVNNISAFASIELNLDVLNKDFAEEVEDKFRNIISDSIEITEEFYRTKFSLFSRFIQWLSYNIVKALFFLFTFYFRQRE